MAGEIQLNSTTALTEDTGAITLNNVNSATNRTNLGLGSIATQASGSIDIDGGAIDGVTIGTNSAATDVRVDNLKLDGNTISSTNTDGNIVLDPNGTGNVLLGNFTLDADQTVGAGQDNMVLTYDYAQGTIGLEAAANAGTIASQDSDAVAITGGSITGTEFDLKSTGTSVYKSNGSTAVISESGGTATLNNVTLGSSVVFPSGIIIGSAFNNYTDTTSTAVGSNNGFVDCTGSETYLTIKSTSSKFYVVWMNSLSNATSGGRGVLNVYYKKTDSGGSGGSYVSITGVTSGANLGVTQSSQPHDSNSNDTFTGMLEISNQSQSVGDRLYCKVMIAAALAGRTIRNNRNADAGNAYNHRTISSLQIFEVAQ